MRPVPQPPAVFEQPPAPVGRKARLVITICSAGKRLRTQVSASDLPRGDLAAVTRSWLELLGSESALVAAEDLYKGRAFTTAKAAAAELDADLGVVSAGLGYITAQTAIPAYDLTVRRKAPGAVAARVDGAFDEAAWWAHIARGPFASPIADDLQGRDLVLVCLSRTYAPLIAPDLVAFALRRPQALRLFGLSLSKALPPALRPHLLPYDARLEQLGEPGARSDFAQRALRDFVGNVLPFAGDLEGQVALVRRRMAAAPPAAKRPPQRRADDEALKAAIRRLMPSLGGGAQVLAHLRRVEGLSCEQRRFAGLFQAVKAERAA